VPASITHLVVGEHVIKQYYPQFPGNNLGSFYAGCMLIDVHAFTEIDRRQTHFVGRVEEAGESAYKDSCNNYLKELRSLLNNTWKSLNPIKKSFVAGYLCHLAVDECWKKLGVQLFQKLGITSWSDFVVPGDVGLTTFDFISNGQLMNKPEIDLILNDIIIPDTFKHIPYKVFAKQWEIIREYVISGGTPESHFMMLERAGKAIKEIQETRKRYDTYWNKGIEFIKEIGGVEPFIQDAIDRTMQVMPQIMDQ
jgi:hypothetical protein